MKKSWMLVFIFAFFEVGWVVGLKHADQVLEWAGTFAAILVSFYGMIKASQVLPIGTVYAVFVGLGTAGAVIADIVLFHAPVAFGQIALIATLLIGVIGLKILSDSDMKYKHEKEENA